MRRIEVDAWYPGKLIILGKKNVRITLD